MWRDLGHQELPQDGDADARQTLLDSRARWCNALEGAGDFAHVALNDRGEQRFLAGEPRIERRLSGTATSAISSTLAPSKPPLEKHLRGRVQDPLLDLAGELVGRPAGSDNDTARRGTLSRRHSLLHDVPFTWRRPVRPSLSMALDLVPRFVI